MKKKILYVGDSITEGISGVNYVKYIEKEFPNYLHINQGLGGDTLLGISNRLMSLLENEEFNYIVFEAGHNDIIIPYFEKQGLLLKMTAKKLRSRGSIPTDINNFKEVLENKMREIKKITNAEIILTTLSCIGEVLNSDLNNKRAVINRSIKEVAKKYKCKIANVGDAFDEKLRRVDSGNYLLGGFYKLMLIDPIFSKKNKWAEKISRHRKLYLTIDGVHINGEGAKIYANEIIETLRGCPDFV
ncbi:SGNH/GDSL hydrolase family protein [Thermohalobacter berrensis]|uniref:Uncharacterized protein n=1 Tax=Thermohalobacter berrensis TaxID=99594 RepID=A0A419T1A6_9FIRM|nr:GDSL-type esterase/lipase family protein [Thermohalobacter berrensis]RKD31209.1 hypothetical protein BET03_03520 [Thermohalobacter berrensis]